MFIATPLWFLCTVLLFFWFYFLVFLNFGFFGGGIWGFLGGGVGGEGEGEKGRGRKDWEGERVASTPPSLVYPSLRLGTLFPFFSFFYYF